MEAARYFRRNRGAMAGLIILVALILGSVLAPWLSPYDPYEPGPNRLAPPSREHPLGTDPLGRDVLSRILHGGRVSLQVGIFAVGMALVAGSALGLIAAYFEGWVDNVIMRVMDFLLAFPGMLLAIALIGVLGPSLFNVMLALGISSVPSYTRVVRGTALSVKQNDYVQAARAVGGGFARIVSRHLAPNIAAPVIVMPGRGRRHPGHGRPELHRAGPAPSHPRVGGDAGHGPVLPAPGLVAGDLSRAGDHPVGPGDQPGGRWAAGRPGPTA